MANSRSRAPVRHSVGFAPDWRHSRSNNPRLPRRAASEIHQRIPRVAGSGEIESLPPTTLDEKKGNFAIGNFSAPGNVPASAGSEQCSATGDLPNVSGPEPFRNCSSDLGLRPWGRAVVGHQSLRSAGVSSHQNSSRKNSAIQAFWKRALLPQTTNACQVCPLRETARTVKSRSSKSS